MKKFISILKFMRNTIEVYIPVASFIIMFVIFIVQVFSRYVLRQPIPWAYEVTVTAYLWLVMLGAILAQRDNAHVRFTLIYDKLSIKGKAICSFLGNMIIAVAFGYSFIPSIRFIDFMRIQETSVLNIGLHLIYAPYIPFVAFIFVYIVMDMYKEFMVFTGLGGEEMVKELLEESKPEYLELIEAAREKEGK